MTDGYRFRWRCDACHESGEWCDTPDAALDRQAEHEQTHDEPLYGAMRIQRYPEREITA